MNKRRLSFYRRARAVLLASKERTPDSIILNCQMVKPMACSSNTLSSDKGRTRVKRQNNKIHR